MQDLFASGVKSCKKVYKYIQKASKGKLVLITVGTGATYLISHWLFTKRAIRHPKIPSYHCEWRPWFGTTLYWLNCINNRQYHRATADILLGAKIYCEKHNYDSPKGVYKATWYSRGGLWNTVQLLDPDLIKYVFETKFESFIKGDSIQQRLSDLLGNGIFVSDPPQWRSHRLAASRMFSMRNLQDFMFDTAYSQCSVFIKKLQQLSEDKDHEIDIYDLFAKYTLDTFGTIAFGQSLGIIENIPNEHPFSVAFDGYLDKAVFRWAYPWWKSLKYLEVGYEKDISQNVKIIDKFANDIIVKRINEYLNENNINGSHNNNNNNTDLKEDETATPKLSRQLTDETGNAKQKHDILSLFLKYDDNLQPLKKIIERNGNMKRNNYNKNNSDNSQVNEAKKKLSNELKHIAMNMIIAGRDTTRLLLSWFIYELSNHPEVEEKVRDEISLFYKKYDKLTYSNIQNHFGEKKEEEENHKRSKKKESNFKYLECCLLETLRLHPPVSFLTRWAVEDVELPGTDGWVIRKGEEVSVLPWILARLPWLWGQDCAEFKPMRWYDKGINSFATSLYPVFNIAPRLCLGRQVAIMEAKIMVIEFLKHFRFELIPKQEIIYISSPLLNMKNGMKIKMFDALNAEFQVKKS